ncbi:MAG: FKBP-type peptidyl-prolyl cis-trans isomerase [Rikenellaceae bacterium]
MKLAKKIYKENNKNFLIKLAKSDDINTLSNRVLYKVIQSGTGTIKPELSDVVSVHYRGTFIDNREFESTLENSYPETFRVREVIEGWQIALREMVVGDKWQIFIPYNMGYGDKGVDNIPGYSTLIFEIELIKIN